jgi:hypothetical protein
VSPPSIDLLAESRRMLDEAEPSTVSAWSRASALLARQALEEALTELWISRAPGVQRLNMRAQLNCLHSYISDAVLVSDVAFTWHALSRATHHHPYELDPTAEELRTLVSMTARIVAALAQPGHAGVITR